MAEPTAFGWIDFEVSSAPEWHRAQVIRLARTLGYRIIWPDERSLLPVADQAREAGADIVILPAPDHLAPTDLTRTMDFVDVEVVRPRLTFARWRPIGARR
ncbi:hypothetical protein K7711_09070 [Nocardia sp. CA2R105]|uniref:hypothetical protein n=1 Tax=Nocardia coffeae TaxID=2873381 RepID=UPI001CA744B3|nr:hypothetical protein [Nocardia coffeae]MBY8856624.1 hypothetical protein [Nocardia coffeae]